MHPISHGVPLPMPGKELYDHAKAIIKQMPGIQGLNGIRHKIIRLRDLSALLRKNAIVAFQPHAPAGGDETAARELAGEVVREWLELYGIVHLRRETAMAIDAPAGAALLYAPQALLKIPASHEEYLQGVERETRRVIRLAEKRGYEFRTFDWNDHLDEIYEINTSKEIRQSVAMRGWYREPVQPRHHSREELQYRRYHGAFKDGKLYAYFHFYLCGDLAIGKHFIGHAQHLAGGVMSGLISYTVRECIRDSALRWLHYGEWQRKGSLNAFKQHAGFRGYAILLDLERDPELRKYSEQKVRTLWRL